MSQKIFLSLFVRTMRPPRGGGGGGGGIRGNVLQRSLHCSGAGRRLPVHSGTRSREEMDFDLSVKKNLVSRTAEKKRSPTKF